METYSSGLKTFHLNEIDSRLLWKDHINAIADKAHKRNNLRKTFTTVNWGVKQEVLASAYKTYTWRAMKRGSEFA